MKKYIIPVAAFIAGMAIVPSVFAVEGGSNPIKEWGGATSGLVGCLQDTEKVVCTLEDNITVSGGEVATIKSNKTLNLNGKKLTFDASYAPTGNQAIATEGDVTLTVEGGTIEMNAGKSTILVQKGGSLIVEDGATINGSVWAGEPKQITVAGTIDGGTTTALGVTGTTKGNASNVAISGKVTTKGTDKAYTQDQNVNAVITGEISNEFGGVAQINGGTVTLTGAHLDTVEGNVLVFGKGANIVATIDGCSELTSTKGAALFFNAGAVIESLTVKNSTLTSKQSNTIKGNTADVQEVVLEGALLKAGKNEKVKAGSTEFDKATYDGHELEEDENILTEATGSYGTLAAACGGTATDEGEDKGEEAENPNTADTIATYLTIATVALLGLGATAFVAKKSNR